MRIFIALDLPKSAVEMLCAVQQRLLSAGAGGRPVDEDSMHITLRFLGELTASQTENVCRIAMQALSGMPSPLIRLEGIGTFIRTGGDTVYANIGGDIGAVAELEKTLTAALSKAGYPRDYRPFMPHITLLRGANLSAMRMGARSEQFFCSSVGVYSSELTPKRAVYDKLCEIPLSR